MSGIALVVVQCLLTWADGSDLAVRQYHSVQGFIDKFADKSASKLFKDAFLASHIHHASLENMSFGKPGHLIDQRSLLRLSSNRYSRGTGLCARLPLSNVDPDSQHHTTHRESAPPWVGHDSRFQMMARLGYQGSRSLSVRSSTSSDTVPVALGRKIPVTVVTGFLGSGKTTLLNNILTKSHGKRIAVIENEYGEIGIDQELVAAAKAGGGDDAIMMLNNGCLCCTVRGDLVKMILELTTKYREKFDHIVIETTGLASIAPIIQTFYAEPSLEERVSLDGIVTLVDAKHVSRHLDGKSKRADGSVNEALEQIAYADRIVLNKIDLVNVSDLSMLESRLRSVNGMAEITRAEKAAVGVEYVLGVGGFDLAKIEHEGVEASDHQRDHHHAHSHAHTHEHHEHGHPVDGGREHDKEAPRQHSHQHNDRLSSLSIEVKGDVDYNKLNSWLANLNSQIHEDVYRMKGILAIHGVPNKFVFQGVHAVFDGRPLDLWKEGEERTSKIVFIGKDLPKDMIRNGFKGCMADENSVAPNVESPTGEAVQEENAPEAHKDIEKRLEGISKVLEQVKSGKTYLPDRMVYYLVAMVEDTRRWNQSPRTEEEKAEKLKDIDRLTIEAVQELGNRR